MSSKVVPINRAPKPIAHYLRLGQGCHRQLEDLEDSGDLPFTRVVVDASRLDEQQELVQSLIKGSKEIVLDPNMAELSTVGGSAGQARHLPWAKKDGFWRPSDMDDSTLRQLTRAIAEKAVASGCNAVKTPSHLLGGIQDPWLDIDISAACMLREELDAAGAQNISVDYLLSIQYADLRDPQARQIIIERLRDVPFENLWLRIPNFGARSTGAMVYQYVSAVSDILAGIGRHPVVADYAGGLPALAVCAFGSVGGIAHGVAEKEQFNPQPWSRPRTSPFHGRARRIYVPRLDMYFTEREFQELWEVNGTRSRLICNDPSCCARGTKNMTEKRHVLYQRARQVAELNRVPELSRPEHMLHKQLETVGQEVRQFERISALDSVPEIKKKLSKRSAGLDRLSNQLKRLTELRGMLQHSGDPRHRGHHPIPVTGRSK